MTGSEIRGGQPPLLMLLARHRRRRILSGVAPCVSSLAVTLLAALLFTSSAYAATASWSLTPPNYDFGAVQPDAGPSSPGLFTLTNTGEVDLSPPRVEFRFELPEGREPGLFEYNAGNCESRASLATGESCKVEVTFDPLYPGPRSGSLTLIDTSSQIAPVTASFYGVGIGPIVSLSPPLLSLGSYLVGKTQAPPAAITLANTGNADLYITAISLENLGTNPNQVAIVGGTCRAGGTVAANGSCTIQVTFTPTQNAEFSAQLRVTDNAAHGFQEVTVRGRGVAYPPEPPPARTVRIWRRPPAATMRRAASFRFGVNGGGVPFACKLDNGPFRPCRSPRTYRRLALGTHTFRVKPRVKAVGLWSGAAVVRFRIIPKNTR